MNIVKLGPSYFPDPTKSRAVSGGSIYVGLPDLDPAIVANRKAVYALQEDGTTVSITQPVSTTAGGQPVYNGSPVTLLVEGEYSLKVLDSAGVQKNYVPSSGESGDVGVGFYYPNYAAPDQGVTGDSDTIKYAVETLGTDSGTIYLSHNSGNATTTYTFLTSEAIPSNVNTILEKGAIISVASGDTLTFYSPEQIIAGKQQLIFSGAGSAAFTKPGEYSAGWRGVSPGETSSNNQAYLADVMGDIIVGCTIYMPPATYPMTGLFTISKTCILSGYGAKLDWDSDTSASRGVQISASDVEIRGLALDGPQHASSVTTQKGIHAYGADSSNYISNIKIVDAVVTDWGIYGLHFQFVQDFEVRNNHLHALYLAGIALESCQDGKICENIVEDIDTNTNTWGVFVSRTEHDSLVTHPRSKRIVISDNVVKDVTKWTGLDSHGGEKITFSNNIIQGCLNGISVGPSDNGSDVPTFAPLESVVIGNNMDSGVTDGTFGQGIYFTGAASVQDATGAIINNMIRGYGDQDVATSGGMFIRDTEGLVISGNAIIEASPNGIAMVQRNEGFNIIGNTIIDSWSTALTGYGIRFDDGNNVGFAGNNVFGKDSKSATSVMASAYRIDDNATDDIVIGDGGHSEADDWITGGGTAQVRFGTEGGVFMLKDVFEYTDFASAATTVTHDFLLTLQAGYVVTDVWWQLDTEFSGGSVSAITLEFGVAGVNGAGFFPTEDVFTGAGTGFKDSATTSRGVLLYDATPVPIQYFCTGSTTLRATVRLTGDDGDQLTAGKATVWVRGYRVK